MELAVAVGWEVVRSGMDGVAARAEAREVEGVAFAAEEATGLAAAAVAPAVEAVRVEARWEVGRAVEVTAVVDLVVAGRPAAEAMAARTVVVATGLAAAAGVKMVVVAHAEVAVYPAVASTAASEGAVDSERAVVAAGSSAEGAVQDLAWLSPQRPMQAPSHREHRAWFLTGPSRWWCHLGDSRSCSTQPADRT